MDEKIFGYIQNFITESNIDFKNDRIENALAKTEKAYSFAINYENCNEITRKKIEFNLATLYACLNNQILSKAYLDRVAKSTITFIKKRDIGLLYTKLGNDFDDRINERIECYNSAAENFSKSKDWERYCNVQLINAKLLNDCNLFKESSLIADKIQMACFNLENNYQLAKIYCDLATIYAMDAGNETRIKHSKRLLLKSLKLIKKEDGNNNLSRELEVFIYQNLAAINNNQKQYHESLKFIESAYSKLKSFKMKKENFILSDLKFNEGHAKAKLNQMPDAIAAFTESHEYALKTNQKNVWESLEEIGTLYASNGYYEIAKDFYDKAIHFFNLHYEKTNQPINPLVENRILIKRKLIKKQFKQPMEPNSFQKEFKQLNKTSEKITWKHPSEIKENQEPIKNQNISKFNIEHSDELESESESDQDGETNQLVELKNLKNEPNEIKELVEIKNFKIQKELEESKQPRILRETNEKKENDQSNDLEKEKDKQEIETNKIFVNKIENSYIENKDIKNEKSDTINSEKNEEIEEEDEKAIYDIIYKKNKTFTFFDNDQSTDDAFKEEEQIIEKDSFKKLNEGENELVKVDQNKFQIPKIKIDYDHTSNLPKQEINKELLNENFDSNRRSSSAYKNRKKSIQHEKNEVDTKMTLHSLLSDSSAASSLNNSRRSSVLLNNNNNNNNKIQDLLQTNELNQTDLKIKDEYLKVMEQQEEINKKLEEKDYKENSLSATKEKINDDKIVGNIESLKNEIDVISE